MSISSKGTSGVTAECPSCHNQIPHGFQICPNCRHTLSAAEQTELRKELSKNVVVVTVVGFVVLAAVMYLAYG